MGVLAPGAFAAGAALALVVLAIHFLKPSRPQRRVSSTFLWLATLQALQRRPFKRVPPNLLLFLQLLALAAIATALARPFVSSPEAAGTDAIVLLDVSASMQATEGVGGPSRFEAARERVRAFIDDLQPDQGLTLISLGPEPRVVAPRSGDRALLRQALASLRPTTRPANLAAGLSLAGSLAEGHPDTQVIVVGDGSLDRSQVPGSLAFPVRYVAVGSPAENLALAAFGTRVVDGRLSALASIANYGSQPRVATVELRVDGARFDASSVPIQPGGSGEAEWADVPGTARVLEARLVEPDALGLDNSAWAIVGGERPTRVLLVSEGNVFLERALGLRPGVQVTRRAPGRYSPEVAAAQPFDLVVFDGFVPATLPDRGSILVLHPAADNPLVAAHADVPVSRLNATRADDPLLADVPLEGVHVNRARRLDAPPWADVVLDSPETPVLLKGEPGGQRVAVLGFDVHQSDLPLQPAFPILVQHLLDWLAPGDSVATPAVRTGEPATLVPLPSAQSIEVVTPDGRTVRVAPPFPAPPFADTDTPGVYRIVQRDAGGRETESSLAANFVSPRESRLAPGEPDSPPWRGSPAASTVGAPREVWQVAALIALAVLMAEWLGYQWQRSLSTLRARLTLACRAISCGLLALAVIGLAVPLPVDRQAVIFVGDLSASAQPARLQQERFIADALAARRADDVFAVVATGRQPVVERGLGGSGGFERFAARVEPDGTDLAGALRLAGSLLPAGYRGRVAVLSDGQETTGNAAAEARALRASGRAQVDVVPLAVSSGPEVLVDEIAAPSVVREGERFGVRVHLVSNVATSVRVRAYLDDAPLGEQVSTIGPGMTDLTFGAQSAGSGLHTLRATLEAEADTLTQNNAARAIVEVRGPPRVLVVEERPGEGAAVASALASAGMRVETRSPSGVPDQLDGLGAFAAVVLADVSADSLDEAQQSALRAYVRDLGRGLLAIGGDSSFGQGGYAGTPLDELLPVRSSVRSHRDQGRVALVLVIDRSTSMAEDPYHEGTSKLDMARQAAALSVQQLTPRDLVGMVAFDTSQHWIVPIGNLASIGLPTLQQHLAALTAEGGTDVYPALQAGFEAIRDTDAPYKHLILLTDGMSCCGGNYPALLDTMQTAHVTLSTIAVGGDADQELLARLAHQGDGRYYFADHARDIPRLMARETSLATRGPVVEGQVIPRQVAPDGLLSQLVSEGLPALGGYLATSPKDLADVLLASDAGDPLLARWPYGLGRAVAWTSDLRGRWSGDWLAWPGLPRLLASLVNWTIPSEQGPLRVRVRAGPERAQIAVEESEPQPAPAQVRARVAGPAGESSEVDLLPTAPGLYQGAFSLGGPGTYLARVEERRDGELVATADAGLPVAYAAEFRRVSADPQRLRAIAAAGGGHVLSSPAAAFADDLPPVSSPLPLARTLLVLAAVLLPVELALRRLRPWRDPLPPVPAWMPAVRPAPDLRRVSARVPLDPRVRAPVAPALAREVDPGPGPDEEDALGYTLRWLESRRRGGRL